MDDTPKATPGAEAPPPSDSTKRIDALVEKFLPKLEELLDRFLNPPKPAEGGVGIPGVGRVRTPRELAALERRWSAVPLVSLTERSGVLFAGRADGAVFEYDAVSNSWGREIAPVPGTVAALPPEVDEEAEARDSDLAEHGDPPKVD